MGEEVTIGRDHAKRRTRPRKDPPGGRETRRAPGLRISRVTTKAGDDGSTALATGERVSKASPRIEALGAADELASAIGLARALGTDPATDGILAEVQNGLFVVGADLATPAGAPSPRVDAAGVASLEKHVERIVRDLPPLVEFVLPGGGPAGSALHLARAVCRRAERAAVRLAETEQVSPTLIVYLNRLSDLLFCLARLANRRDGVAEVYAHFSRRSGPHPQPLSRGERGANQEGNP